jgi:Ca-activated chloride channel homolog
MKIHGSWGKHLRPALLVAGLAVFFCVSAVHGQSTQDLPPPPPPPTPRPTPKPTPVPTPKDDDFDVIRTSSNLVMVPVSVIDAAGQAVLGLPKGDFRLEEQGREQQITELGNPEQVPLDIVLLFDISSSVSQKGFFLFQQKAAASFLRQVMKPTDRAAVFTIGAEPVLFSPLASAEVAAAKLQTIPAAVSQVPTAFYDTVAAAAAYLAQNSASQHRRVILVISDGEDTNSSLVKEMSSAEVSASQNEAAPPGAAKRSLDARRERAVLEVQKVVQQADVAFYSVNPGGRSVHLNLISTRSQNQMRSIAESTGGTAFIPDSELDLEQVFREVAAELRGQYLLQYYSNAQTPSPDFRSIKVLVPTRPELRVRARQGYYPKQK